jgi:hypothetical protein
MNKNKIKKANKKKQEEASKKFKLKSKSKAKPKGKKKRMKMVTYSILTRRSRLRPWRQSSDNVTASNKLLAVHIAAARNPNLWVRVLA